MSGARSCLSQFFIGMLKPSFLRVSTDSGTRSCTARFSTYFRSPPRILSEPGIEKPAP